MPKPLKQARLVTKGNEKNMKRNKNSFSILWAVNFRWGNLENGYRFHYNPVWLLLMRFYVEVLSKTARSDKYQFIDIYKLQFKNLCLFLSIVCIIDIIWKKLTMWVRNEIVFSIIFNSFNYALPKNCAKLKYSLTRENNQIHWNWFRKLSLSSSIKLRTSKHFVTEKILDLNELQANKLVKDM